MVVSDIHAGSFFALADLDDEAVPRGGPGKQTREALFDIWRESAKGKWGEPDERSCYADEEPRRFGG